MSRFGKAIGDLSVSDQAADTGSEKQKVEPLPDPSVSQSSPPRSCEVGHVIEDPLLRCDKQPVARQRREAVRVIIGNDIPFKSIVHW